MKVAQLQRSSNLSNSNISDIKSLISPGQILKILNSINPGYSLATDSNNFVFYFCKELLDLLLRRAVKFKKYFITDDIMKKILIRLLPKSLYDTVLKKYTKILGYYKLEPTPSRINIEFDLWNGTLAKKRGIYECDVDKPLSLTIKIFFIELGLLRARDYVDDKDTDKYYFTIYRELNSLKSEYLLLYNTIPISYNTQPYGIIF